MIIAFIEFLRRRLKTVGLLCCAMLALLVIGDGLLANKEDAHTAPEHWVGFWSAFGFLSCLAIIFFSKWYGHLGIMQNEEYYDDE